MDPPVDTPFRRPLVERLVGNRSIRGGYWSLVVHLAIGVVLAMVVCDRRTDRPRTRPIMIDSFSQRSDAAEAAAGGESAAVVVAPVPSPIDPPVPASGVEPQADLQPAADMLSENPAEPAANDPATTDLATASATLDTKATTPQPVAEPTAAAVNDSRETGSPAAPGIRFGRRRGDARAAAVSRNGGTAASEAAVELGLAWLAAHQSTDGSWRCDLSDCRCDGACRDAGTVASTTASTAIALLPFLGAGHTHEDGGHQQTVSRGIYYLASRLKRTPHGGDLCEGTMYGQGLATLVFAEAFGMTGDDLFRDPLADCIRFIETAQDQYSGGWRYLPGQPGDLTVTAWQIAALKSAQLSGLTVPSPAIDGAVRFLDRVQAMEGAAYGYRSPSAKHSTSAIGLLCRMYTGWKPGDEPLDRGIERLASRPPDPNAIYENFYLAQLLLQADHPAWPRWNARLREALVRSQEKAGHETGSWTFNDRETAPGGRLAHTSLALLVLEVYYRLLPIYGEQAVAPSF